LPASDPVDEAGAGGCVAGAATRVVGVVDGAGVVVGGGASVVVVVDGLVVLVLDAVLPRRLPPPHAAAARPSASSTTTPRSRIVRPYPDPAMDEHRAANRANWDERTPIHLRSEFYDVDGWLRERPGPRPRSLTRWVTSPA
jgi:hypothetical protein